MGRSSSSEDYMKSILILKKRNRFVRSIDVAEEMGVIKPSVPKGMIYGFMAGTGVLGAGFITSMILTKDAGAPLRIGLNTVLGLATLACGKGAQWSVFAQ